MLKSVRVPFPLPDFWYTRGKKQQQQQETESFVPPTTDLLQPRLLPFVLFESSWMQMKVVVIFHHIHRNMLLPGPLYIWSGLQ